MGIGVLVRFANRGQIIMYAIANGAELLVRDNVISTNRECRRKDAKQYYEQECVLPCTH